MDEDVELLVSSRLVRAAYPYLYESVVGRYLPIEANRLIYRHSHLSLFHHSSPIATEE